MKFLLFNCRGLASTHKQSSLKRLVDRVKPEVFFLQETLGLCYVIKDLLSRLLLGCDFLVLDAKGRSGGLAIGWKMTSCRLINSWGVSSCLGVDLYSQELNSEFRLFNIYGLYQNREVFWDCLFSLSLFSHEQIIVGGDLNFSLGSSEIWGPEAIPDPLAKFFTNYLVQKDLIDLNPIKLNPTWRNRWVGEERIAKRLERFLIGDLIACSPIFQARQWVDWGGELDHNPIILEIQQDSHKPPSPFKFNANWISNPDFGDLVRTNWIPLNAQEGSRVGLMLMENIKRLKKNTLK